MTRGFCTIATGSYEYSKLAHNLLLSYRRFSTEKYPFTVITDKTNELLEQFDDVIIINDSNRSFLDKLLLFQIIPYDETIFIDADSLAYGDLGRIFEYFEDADDVSCLGKTLPENSIKGWFRKEDTGAYKESIEYTIWMHGGIYFIRKTPEVLSFFDTCVDIANNYKKYFFRFQYLTEPADEPIVAMAMAIHKFHPIDPKPEIMAFYRDSKILKIDMISGTLSYIVESGRTDAGLLVHWATANTRKALYKNEVQKLKILYEKNVFFKNFKLIIIRLKIKYGFMQLTDFKDRIIDYKKRNSAK